MKKKVGSKLVLAATRVRNLSTDQLRRAAGGASGVATCVTCETNCDCPNDTDACEPTIGKRTLSCLGCGSRTG